MYSFGIVGIEVYTRDEPFPDRQALEVCFVLFICFYQRE
jgi:hypothetical protein